jgi:hypothetical protein
MPKEPRKDLRAKRQKALIEGGAVNRSMLQRTVRARDDHSARRLLDEDVGRESLEEALEFHTFVDKDEFAPAAVMLSRLRDPAFADQSITTIMRDSGLLLTDVLDMLRKRDVALAVASSGRHMGDILNDIAIDAKSQVVTCRGCAGEGVIVVSDGADDYEQAMEQYKKDLADAAELRATGISIDDPQPPPDELEPITEVCEDCDGAGHLRKIGDSDARKLFLGVHGLGQKSGPQTAVTINTQVNNTNTGDKGPESVTSRVQKILDITPQ